MNWPWSKPKPAPFKRGVYFTNLIIEAVSSDHPDGRAQGERPNVPAMARISATKDENGLIWLDGWDTPAGHELQHLCHSADKAFGQPDENIIG